MKIGIMTFWWSDDNYGQLLQCYALQKYLRNAGHDAYLIRYDPRNDYVKTPVWKKILKAFNPVKLARYIHYGIKKRTIYSTLGSVNKAREFDNFRETYIKHSEKIYYSYNELVEESPEADIYIVGSDQVWNFYSIPLKNIQPQLKAYFLDFGKKDIRRIAYAASFGKEKLNDEFMREISPLLKKFEYVSVREKSGLDICRLCGIDNAEWVPDPTMLLSASHYRTLYSPINQPNDKKTYCLLYMLNNECDFSIKLIYDWAKKINIEILYITGNLKHDEYEKIYATIPEWLYMIDKAEYVITNSFHCSVFSLLFQKKFGVIPLTGKFVEMNNRFASMFEIFDIGQRFMDISFSVLATDIDWTRVNNMFEKILNTCDLPAHIQ
jgi:hypothetical protein